MWLVFIINIRGLMMDEKKEDKSKPSVDENKIIAALAYVWILFLVPLLMKKDSDFAIFHAKQGFIFFIYCIILSGVSLIPILGWLIGLVGGTIAVILFVIGIVNALTGKKQELPLIGHYAKKFNI